MKINNKTLKVGAIQLCSQLDPKVNLEKIDFFFNQAKEQDVKACFLPECFLSLSDGIAPTPFLVEFKNDLYLQISNLAQKFQMYILGGSVAFKENGKIYNRSLNFAPSGELIDYYDKIHLFSCNIPATKDRPAVNLNEGNTYTSGSQIKILNLGEFKLGTTICFDIRFPELYRKLSTLGVNLISISSAFTKPTGKDHWEVLVRARAIENQSYVVASAQWGENNHRISTFGHTLIVDPWGQILGNIAEGEGLITAELSIDHLNSIQQRMNIHPNSNFI